MTTRMPLILAGALIAAGVSAQPGFSQNLAIPGSQVDEPPRRAMPAPLGAEALRPAPLPVPPPALQLRGPATERDLDIGSRFGPNQAEEELIRTTLLNRFGSLGFAELGRLEWDGSLYAAEVRTTDGQWIVITIDPRSGEIVARQ